MYLLTVKYAFCSSRFQIENKALLRLINPSLYTFKTCSIGLKFGYFVCNFYIFNKKFSFFRVLQGLKLLPWRAQDPYTVYIYFETWNHPVSLIAFQMFEKCDITGWNGCSLLFIGPDIQSFMFMSVYASIAALTVCRLQTVFPCRPESDKEEEEEKEEGNGRKTSLSFHFTAICLAKFWPEPPGCSRGLGDVFIGLQTMDNRKSARVGEGAGLFAFQRRVRPS